MTGRPVGAGDIVWRVVSPKDCAPDPDQPRKEPYVLGERSACGELH